MSKFKICLLLVVILFSFSTAAQKNTYTKEDYKKLYEEALRYYKIKSYYSALTTLFKITKDKKNPYYVPSAYLLAKVYIKLGKKTGIKKYFNYALYLLNTYLAFKKNVGWDYYYTKGNLFEAWGFYERAMFFYKTSLFMANDKQKYIDSLIGILRTAIWFNKLDIVTQYAIKISIKDILKREDNPEIRFLKGLLYFNQKKYQKAYKYLYNTYKQNEEYLIDNPDFYYIVAENMYRIGKYNFAKQLFRRIVSITQNLEIIRKSILRLGDIEIKQRDYPSAFNHYYYLATDYKGTKESIIAKLKIIAYNDIPDFQKRIQKSDDEDLKNPLKFVLKTLIINRNTRLGRYALADFGKIIFKYNSQLLYKKLSWELSVLEVDRMSYEEKEFFRNIWSSKLLDIKPKWLCLLYDSNKKFFLKVFDKNYLLNLSNRLAKCSMEEKIDLLKKILEIYKDDNTKFELAKAYYEIEMYKESIKILKNIKNKNCNYYILLAKNYVMLDQWKNLRKLLKNIQKCKNPEKELLIAVYNLKRNIITKTQKIINKNLKLIIKNFEKPFYKKLIYLNADKLIFYGKYNYLLQVSKALSEIYKKDCDVNSWLLIANVRLSNYEELDKIFANLKACETKWSLVAKNLYEDLLVERRIQK